MMRLFDQSKGRFLFWLDSRLVNVFPIYRRYTDIKISGHKQATEFMMNAQQRVDLQDLRQAARDRNQEQMQYLLKRLLQDLSFFVALSIPLERIYSFLDIFESYYPEEEWVRKLVLAINSFGMPPDDRIVEIALEQPFNAPGIGNFVKAVYDATQAMQSRHTREARLGYIASAIVNTIMAELAESWYGDRVEDWQRVRQNQYDPINGEYSDPVATEIAYQFWIDPQTAALDTGSWLEVADSIEQKFRRMERGES